MCRPVFVQLDEEVRAELAAQARARGVGLSTLPWDIGSKAAQQRRIHVASGAGPVPEADAG